MGLDATVYRRGHAADDDDCAEYEVIHRRLGNVADVAHLRRQASRRLAASSVVLSKVLYDGSHSGDAVAVELAPAVQAELAALASDDDPGMREFVRSMSELVEAALREANPICF